MAREFRFSLERRVTNRVLVWLLKREWAPSSYYLLTVRGRKSGKPHSVPVVLVEGKDQRWLVAPYGEVDWVKNARASMLVTLSRGDQREDFTLCELSVEEAAPVLKKYLTAYPITRPYFNSREDSPMAAFQEEARTKPVFELTSASPIKISEMKINPETGDLND